MNTDIRKKYAAVLSYDGSGFWGWQKQKSSENSPFPSVQETIEKALAQILRQEVKVVGSGRTDSGVHAAGQVVHFNVRGSEDHSSEKIRRGLNGMLKGQKIQFLTVAPVKDDFHAQRSAVKKQYSYYFQQGPCPIPAFAPYSRWIQKNLNQEAMQEGLDYLVGTHDFKAFQARGAKPGPTIREIFEARVERVELTQNLPWFLPETGMFFLRVRLVGSGFLKQMVRGISGTLLQVGEGRRPPRCFGELLQTLDRNEVGPTAPARGLWLEKVWYPQHYGV